MAITVPSAVNIKMKFAPAFDDVEDATIEFAIQEAAESVDSSWIKQQTLAIMYLAAEFLAVAKSSAATDGREVTSETFGRISVTYKASTSATIQSDAEFKTTYGERFAEIRRLNFPGFAII